MADTIPSHVAKWLKSKGYPLPYNDMKTYINSWYEWMMAQGHFYSQTANLDGHPTKLERMSVRPAMRVCNEWASLLMNEEVLISTDNEDANEWLNGWVKDTGFIASAQSLVSRSFALGTGAWALWYSNPENGDKKVRLRKYDARMIIPLSYDDDGVVECAFCTKAVVSGATVDQVQLHVIEDGTYHIKTQLFLKGKPYTDDSVITDFDTDLDIPSFAVIKPAIDNTRVDMSPYGQSIFADAVDAVKAVDLAWDAIQNELKLSKMRVFIGDLLLDSRLGEEGKTRYLPFGDDDVVFRKVTSTEDLITTFAPELRITDQISAYRTNWQTLGDLTGFGSDYFSVDKTGGLRTATEVSADNSALMRNIHKHENALETAIISITRALIQAAVKFLGKPAAMANIETISVAFDDSIITDTAADKAQAMLELDRTLNAWEYRMEFYGEDEATAKAKVPRAGIEALAFEA